MSKSSNSKKRKNCRTLRIEELESREMLSVTMAEFDTIKSDYEDLSLGEYADYNIIEIGTNAHTDFDMRAAITEAGQTAEDDLIVVRTTET